MSRLDALDTAAGAGSPGMEDSVTDPASRRNPVVPRGLLETIPINGAPGYLAMSDDRKTLYANDFGGNAVHAVTVAAS